MPRFPRPALETTAAVLVSSGWVAAWSAVAVLAGSWAWLLLGAGVLAVGAGVGAFWWARLRAEIETAEPSRRPRAAA